MRPLLFLLLATLALTYAGCKKKTTTTSYMSTGTIMGQEPFMTPCDAKYWIIIHDSTAGRTFDTLPAGCGINPKFPVFSDSIHVRLNWHNTGSCLKVVVDAIERAD